ncbi:MAG: FAD-dependent thymidylate synthase [Spirochaetaceae bacterium]|jgi:thymidylate synthase (FAD)|nr:FAD-dependent thymidylate synthase [Spirochaetaceae bacterium]
MAHCISAEAEEILDKEFKVLDKGFIRLVDYLGTDERIVQSARVSYGEGTKTYRENAGLIDYLLRNRHTSPFEQVVLTFHIKMPVFIARQWVRHRTARLNEISGRYSVMKDDFYVPENNDISPQSQDNRQGRMTESFDSAKSNSIRETLIEGQRESYKEYTNLIEKGLARELARINLPLSIYTELYWQIDLNNLFHFLELRMGAHAQKEIRLYAQVLFNITKHVAPQACTSFENHILGSTRFSKQELAELKRRLFSKDGTPVLEERALERFEEKLK